MPDAIPSAEAVAGLGFAAFTFTTPPANVAQVRLWHSLTNDFASAEAVRSIAADSSTSYSLTHGDATRNNLLANGDFSADADWNKGAGWTISGGTADHAAGTSSELSQDQVFVNDKAYRFGFALALTAGTLTPALAGGTATTGDAAAATGNVLGRLVAASGNDSFALSASSDFAGSVDNAALYLETAACLDQGVHYYWLTAANDEGVDGPALALGAITIV